VDVDVGPVVEVERGDPERAVSEDLMVASEIEPLHLGDEILFRPLGGNDGVAEVAS
jgi:hypothetical protein